MYAVTFIRALSDQRVVFPDWRSAEMKTKNIMWNYLDELAKEPAADVVVRLEEDLPESGLPDGVVLGVELVKPVKRVPILARKMARTLNLVKYATWECSGRGGN